MPINKICLSTACFTKAPDTNLRLTLTKCSNKCSAPSANTGLVTSFYSGSREGVFPYLRIGAPRFRINRQKFCKLRIIRLQNAECYSTNTCPHVPLGYAKLKSTRGAVRARRRHRPVHGQCPDIAEHGCATLTRQTHNCFRKGEGSCFGTPSSCPPPHDGTHYSAHSEGT